MGSRNFDFKLIRRDGRDFLALNDIAAAALKAVTAMGLEGEEAERKRESVEKIIVGSAALNGIGVVDTDSGRAWSPEEIIEIGQQPANHDKRENN